MKIRGGRGRRIGAVTLACFIGCSAIRPDAAAQVVDTPAADPSAPPQDAILFLETAMNGVETKKVLQVRAAKNGALYVSRSDLLGLRIALPDGPKEVALGSVKGLKAKYDEERQRLELTADPAILQRQDIDALKQGDGVPLQTGTGFLINYNLTATTPVVSNFSKLKLNGASAYLDSRYFSPLGSVEMTMGLRAYSDALTAAASVMRYDTSYVFADPDTRMTYVAGDMITGSLAWTHAYRAGGVQVRRDFTLRPDLITLPLLSTSGTAAVPSTIDVLLGGVKTYSTEVDSGPYTLKNIPVLTNVSGAKIIVRDATGRQTEVALPFFVGASLLAKGLLDYSFEIGAPRENFGLHSFGYSRLPLATGSLRYGLTDRLTVEGHFETQAGLLNAGAGVATTIFDMAQVTLAAAGSRLHDAYGGQLYGSVTTKLDRVNMEVASTIALGDYRDLSYTTALQALRGVSAPLNYASLEPPRWTHRLSVSAPVSDSGAVVNLNLLESRRTTGDTRIISSGVTQTLRPYNASISAFAYADLGSVRSKGVFVNLSVPLGANLSGNVSAQYDESHKIRPYASFAKLDDGMIGTLSYMGSAAYDANSPAGRGAAQYRTSVGALRGEVRATSAGGIANASFEGAIVFSDSSVHFANPITDSFAIVKVGKPDVSVLLENRPAGVTGKDGAAIIVGLRSNETNKISIDSFSLPLDFRVTDVDRLVKPARRSGALVEFKASSANSALVTLVTKGGDFVSVGSTVRMNGGAKEIIVGYDGEVWIDGDLLDKNELVVTGPEGSCKADFAFAPQGAEMFTRIDKVTCK